ncbi:MAG: SpoIID/LytB domain-containing protein [Gemmiger sp.]|nr:SpoIID/LytB domain-containing protein [Gemmiger sp.]
MKHRPPALFSAQRTLVAAALLAVLAAAAPFLCLLPLPGASTGDTGPAGNTGNTGDTARALPTAPPAATAAPTAPPTQEPLLVWDEGTGQLETLSVEEYLVGAAACEVPITWPDEAIRAQMVACHSYILYQKANGSNQNGGYLTVNSSQCSGWATKAVLSSRWGDDYGKNYARLQLLAQSVQYSLLLYEGEPAAACYHAISAGQTQASQNVWKEALPYLQGVDSNWDRYADGYEVSIQYSSQQMRDALSMNLGVTPEGDPNTWVGDTTWDAAGYVESISLAGQSFRGTAVRSALNLRSACFAIAWQGSQFVLTTRGYGHGVGLSQYGACAMAKGGSTWQQILAYYYPGTTLGQG